MAHGIEKSGWERCWSKLWKKKKNLKIFEDYSDSDGCPYVTETKRAREAVLVQLLL
jgi:hypothetical protein